MPEENCDRSVTKGDCRTRLLKASVEGLACRRDSTYVAGPRFDILSGSVSPSTL